MSIQREVKGKVFEDKIYEIPAPAKVKVKIDLSLMTKIKKKNQYGDYIIVRDNYVYISSGAWELTGIEQGETKQADIYVSKNGTLIVIKVDPDGQYSVTGFEEKSGRGRRLVSHILTKQLVKLGIPNPAYYEAEWDSEDEILIGRNPKSKDELK